MSMPGKTVRPLLPALIAALLCAGAAASRATAEGPNDVLPEAPGKELVVRACTGCHQAPMIVAKHHTADEWDELIGKMVDRGATLTEAEQDQVFQYLVANFGPPNPP